MFSFLFNKKRSSQEPAPAPITVDMHSHLLPGIDDGAATLEDTLAMVEKFVALGYQKLITTPHIMHDFYKNTPEIILGKLEVVRQAIAQAGFEISIDAAAEYYLDEGLIAMLDSKSPLLTFGDNYLLFETSYMNEVPQMHEVIFAMLSQGYQPILAHPERYTYYFGRYKQLCALKEKGVLFQLNINSLTGYYSKPSQEIAQKLVDDGLVDLIGSDAHKARQLDTLEKCRKLPYYQKLNKLPLLNNALIAS